MITKIGSYFLNQTVKEAPDLREFTAEEYQMFEMTGYKRKLKDEKIYHGEETYLNGNSWYTILGTTNGRIYKIALQIMDVDKKHLDDIFKSTLNYIIREMGKYNEHQFLSKKYIWDAPEGNIIFERLCGFGQRCVNIFITSNSIREQIENHTHRTQYL